MADYIERESVRNELYDADAITMRGVAILNNFPSADVVEGVHGRWVHDGQRIHNGVDWWHCSECNTPATGVEIKYNYCPNCGAKMDGDGNG